MAQGDSAGAEWVYENPFPLVGLANNEIAIAQCLMQMSEYATGGHGYYGLAEDCHDHYLVINGSCGYQRRGYHQPISSLVFLGIASHFHFSQLSKG